MKKEQKKTISKVVTDFKETLQSRRLSFDRGDDSFGTKLLGVFDMTLKETDKKVWESS